MHSIERTVLLRAPRTRVWKALTDVKKFSQWFCGDSVEGEFAPGARVRVNASPEQGGNFDIFVQEMQPEHLFTWRWHPGAHEPSLDYTKEPTTLVTFKLTDAEGGTLLTITETGFDDISLARRAKVFGQNNRGWDEQVRNLERYVKQTA